jgi:phosphoribosylformimino-5-aminoimidazole carboxamide ribotide isomerase
MKVIPVIDLKAGAVVHARRGARDSYRPIASPLCRGSAPAEVVAGLLTVYPFDTLYIADLDAIQGQADHGEVVAAIGARFPQLKLWVDCGLRDAAACRAWLARGLGTLVLGSEAAADATVPRQLRPEQERVVLSLDFRDGFLGPPALLDDVDGWPDRVIVMTLARVGSGAGPDVERLDEVRHRAGSRKIFAAGGVRGGEDLIDLARRGVSGVLVATALHDRRIGRGDIAALEDVRPA